MTENALARLSAATQALAEARTVDEIKQIMNLAEAARLYAKKANLGLEAQNHAAEIHLDGARKAGEMLRQLEKKPGERTDITSCNGAQGSEYRAVLEDTGTSRFDANRWQAIASLPDDVYTSHKEAVKAQRKELTISTALRVVEAIKHQAMVEEKRTRPLPSAHYRVICADPPWQYDNSGFDIAASNLYPTMPLAEICALPIASLATDSTVLFLWATNPLLPEALQVLAAWGFTYKTNLAWIKDHGRGKGWFLRSKHELLLIGVRPETPHPMVRPDSCFEAERGPVHSRKPQRAYDLIEQMYDAPRIELFAREVRPGWDVWGNEPDL